MSKVLNSGGSSLDIDNESAVTSSESASVVEEDNVHMSNSSSPKFIPLRGSLKHSASVPDTNRFFCRKCSKNMNSCDFNSHRLKNEWVKFNVGGQIFSTTRTTLARDENGFLFRLTQGDSDMSTDKDEDGAYLIDRDPNYFSPVLNFLRHGKLILNSNVCEEGVLEEAEFYNLDGLIMLCRDKIAHRESQKGISKGLNSVYRVLQCSEDELTPLVSNMSDGWHLEQLVNIGAPNFASYDGTDKGEFLCIVSKEYPNQTGNIKQEQTDRGRVLQNRAWQSRT